MDEHSYDDIINLPNPTSKNHPRMSLHDRAAQFAPFAALTGHKQLIQETQRLTEDKKELDENKKANIKINDHICFTSDYYQFLFSYSEKTYYYYQNKDSILNEVKKIKKSYGPLQVLKGVDLTIGEKEIVTIGYCFVCLHHCPQYAGMYSGKKRLRARLQRRNHSGHHHQHPGLRPAGIS